MWAVGIVVAVSESRRLDAQATPIDSLVNALGAPQWLTRATALSAIRSMQAPLPVGLGPAIVALVKREALAPQISAGDDAYGEYIMDLALAAVQAGDRTAIPSLIALGGIEVSSGVASFIASGGPPILPVLDSVQRAAPLQAGVVLETVGLMYVQQGARLGRSDSAAVLARILGAASSPSFTARSMLSYLALRIPLPELVPALRILAASDTFQLLPEGIFPVRLDAQVALDTLASVWNTLSAPAILAALDREVAGSCSMTSGSLFGHCQSMSAHLAVVNQHLGDANKKPALNGVKDFRKALQQAAGAGLAPLIVTLMDANAARLAQLLGG